jgi:hypothetical protein
MATRLLGPAIEVVFGVVLPVSAYLTLCLREAPAEADPPLAAEGLAQRLRLTGGCATPAGDV